MKTLLLECPDCKAALRLEMDLYDNTFEIVSVKHAS